jgi:hypothetical protein
VDFFFVIVYSFKYNKLIEDLNFFHNVFKTFDFVCSFLTFNPLFCLIVLLLLGLLFNRRSILFLGFVLLGCLSGTVYCA